MATSLTDVLAAIQNAVQAINNLNKTVSTVFPGITAASTTAPTAGTITFTSSQAKGFFTVTSSTGGTFKVPGY